MNQTIDPHSFSRPQDIKVKHLSLGLSVNFLTKTLSGYAIWHFEKNNQSADILTLDTHFLRIESVENQNGESVSFSLGTYQEFLGTPLIIVIKEDTEWVKINYHTTDKSLALQWLNPEQTEGKKYPFLFTQSQAILARTWIPCQDSPAIRFTYDASIKTDKELWALMSAINPQEENKKGIYTFQMENPIPSYLMSLAVGNLAYQSIDERTGIYAEPEMLSKAEWEFSDTGKMVTAAEQLYGAYRWERYDLLILPPSFPFGGMENPILTYCTPTVIAGDKSLTSLIAHELAHSWSGNLVTNATWNDFWLNEGFTVYFERRIMEALYGKQYGDMLSEIGFSDLQTIFKQLQDTPNDTCLKLNLDGRDPDDGMNPVAYEKGYLLLIQLESWLGRDKFDKWLSNYFSTYAFQSMDTEQWIDIVSSLLNNKEQIEIVKEWIYKPFLPTDFVSIKSDIFNSIRNDINAYKEGKIEITGIPFKGRSSHEQLFILKELTPILNKDLMGKLDDAYHLTDCQNSEIFSYWALLCFSKDYTQNSLDNIKIFAGKVGRRKFVVPIYKEWSKLDFESAKAFYISCRGNYHPVTSGTLDELFNLSA